MPEPKLCPVSPRWHHRSWTRLILAVTGIGKYCPGCPGSVDGVIEGLYDSWGEEFTLAFWNVLGQLGHHPSKPLFVGFWCVRAW